MTRLTLLLIPALAAYVHAQPGRLTIADQPEPAKIEGYEKAHCVALQNRVRICKVLSESAASFIVRKEGKTIGAWPGKTELGYTEDFDVMRGDLDGDRKPELIVANHESTSNGLGVNYWSIAIFPNTEFRSFQSPLTFNVEEFGTRGTIVSSGGRLNILTTDWVWGHDPKRRRGEGLYLVGQWWRYQRGELLPLPKRIVARRYLLSFANERGATWESDRIPYQWLADRRSDFVATAFITKAAKSSKRGVIESVANDEKNPYRITISFKSDAGQTSEFSYINEDDFSTDRYLGDAVSGRVYPDRYLPPDPEKWLNGRRATLRTYDDKMEILWLEPRRRTK